MLNKPVSHGKLAELLLTFKDTTPNQLSDTINRVIFETNGGVFPEGMKHFPDSAPTTSPAPSPSPVKSGFRFSTSSLNKMKGVKPELVLVAKKALELSTQDFIFFDGVRSLAEQRAMVSRGASKTMASKHLIQNDGFGHAMDLVPYIDGGPKWDWVGCYKIAFAVDEAATQLGFEDNIRWGGAWDRVLGDFGGSLERYEKEVNDYAYRHPGPDFLDGPHFEWVS